MTVAGTQLHWGDILVIIAYFITILVVGLWASCRGNKASVSDYFLAGRSSHWILVGASLFASNIGSGHFIGLAGSGAASGIAVAGFELNAMFILLILGWIFLPVYIAAGVYTMPEYLNRRFGGQRIRVYLSGLALLLYVFTKLSADLYAGAVFIEQSVKWNLYVAVFALLIVASIFTIAGGLTAVLWTDTAQLIIMIAGAAALSIISFQHVGGYNNLIREFVIAAPTGDYSNNISYCDYPRLESQDSMKLIRDPVNGDLPWTGMIFGLSIISTWYWCTDQVIVQRALASKNFTHGKAGCVFGGWLKFLPLWIMVFPGMAARVLFPNEVGCSNPEKCMEVCGSRQGCTNIAFPLLVIRLMPAGARGLMLAVMMSALMSSLTSIFNSASTLFTIDIWLRFRSKASTFEQLIVGKLFVVVLVVISILWIPIILAYPGSQLFNYIQAITSYLAPPVCAVYLLAIFVPRTTEPGAFWGLMLGLAVGLSRFAAEFAYTAPLCGEVDERPVVITKVHYLHFAIILFFITLATTATVSSFTKRMPKEKLDGLTFWTRHTNYVDHTQSTLATSATNFNTQTLVPKQSETEPTNAYLKKLKFILIKLFGLEAPTTTSIVAPPLTLKESPIWYWVCNAGAIGLIAVALFFWGFYA